MTKTNWFVTIDAEPKYIKVVARGNAYYILADHAKEINFEQNNLLSLAQMAVNIKTNEFIKQRWGCEALADEYTGVNR